jgi:hypothetical protein
VWRNVIVLSQFDKSLGKFKKRTLPYKEDENGEVVLDENGDRVLNSNPTTAPYPDIYRAPLARILDIYEEALKDKTKSNKEVQADFSKRFAKLYAELISESLSVSIEGKEQIKGEWVKYNKGNQDEADRLWNSVQAKGTGWCVEGRNTAGSYINQGDFYIYYTYNQQNEPTQPRIAIQMDGDRIGQIRGIQPHQELEPIMADTLNQKLTEFGLEADSYRKKSEDMKRMTEIEKKTNANTPLTKKELTFLYEIDHTIEGFGYDRDPRIDEIRSQRNPEEDMLVIFNCTKEEIATTEEEITEKTKAYLGLWNVTVYNKVKNFPNIQHFYESFPDKKVFTYELHTDPQMYSWEMAEATLKSKGIWVSDYAKDLLQKTEFSKETKTYNLVQFTVGQLGLQTGATTDQIYAQAQELGLELCPAEVGPQLRLSYSGGDWKLIAMKQITDRSGHPHVFYLHRDGGVLELNVRNAKPAYRWASDDHFVFCARK